MAGKQKKSTNRQMKELRDAFNLFDRDQSGSISSSELKQVLIALNFKPTDSLLRKVMKEMDADRNGTIEFDEFVRVMGSTFTRDFTDEEMRRAFQCFDADHSGYITRDELRQVLSQLNPHHQEQRIVDIMNKIDIDHDGRISYDEFVKMLEDI